MKIGTTPFCNHGVETIDSKTQGGRTLLSTGQWKCLNKKEYLSSMKICKLEGGAVVRKETASLEQKIHQERLPSLQLGIMFGTHGLKVV